LTLPLAAAGDLHSTDGVVPGIEALARELPQLGPARGHHDRVDFALRPDLHPPGFLRRIAPDGEDAGGHVEHSLLLDLLAPRLGLSPPGIGAPGPDRLQRALVDLRAIAEVLPLAAGARGDHQLAAQVA